MGDAKLMKRVDTKYLANVESVGKLIAMARDNYKVVEIDSRRLLPYFTRYFDTVDRRMYYDHQRGRKARQKVRIRIYEGDAPLAFIEVKDKNNKGVTSKKRRRLDNQLNLDEHSTFLETHSRFTLNQLVPQIENHFYRITLVRNDLTERITIDTDIFFRNLITGLTDSLPHIAVIEWKRHPQAQGSPMKNILKQLGIRESGFSKYCVGMSRTSPTLKQNRFKPRNRLVQRLAI